MMKRITYFALLFLPFFFTSCGTPNSVAGFYKKHKRKKGVRNFKLPGWAVWVGTGLAYDMVKDEDAKIALRFAKKVKKLRIMVAEEETAITSYDIKEFVNEIKSKGYDDIIYVRDGNTSVNTIAKAKDGKLKDLVFLVKDEDDFVFFSMKSKIKVEDLNELIQTYLGKITKDKKDEEISKKKKKKEKPPQA